MSIYFKVILIAVVLGTIAGLVAATFGVNNAIVTPVIVGTIAGVIYPIIKSKETRG